MLWSWCSRLSWFRVLLPPRPLPASSAPPWSQARFPRAAFSSLLQATAFPASTCTLELRGPARASIMVPDRRTAKSGKLTWRYRIPSHTRSGSWKADISCGSAGNTTAKFSVVPKLSSWSARRRRRWLHSKQLQRGVLKRSSATAYFSRNKSPDVDALGVTVSVSFTDTLGRSVATEKTTLTGVPATGSFYVGGLASSNVSLTVASMCRPHSPSRQRRNTSWFSRRRAIWV